MKTAKVFKQGNSQAVRLPKEFRFQEGEVFVRKNGDNVLLIHKKADRWKHVKACLGKFKGQFERGHADGFDARDWPHPLRAKALLERSEPQLSLRY